jgi:hypothetical protein
MEGLGDERMVRGSKTILRGQFEHVSFAQDRKAIKGQKSSAMWSPIHLLACF